MKNKQILILSAIIILVIGLFFFVKTNNKKKVDSQSSETTLSKVVEQSVQSVIDYSSETETSYSYEKITLSIEELKNYREKIEKAGFDSTLFSDQEIQIMDLELDKNDQSISDYLKNKPEKIFDESEIEKVRKELEAADIDPNKFHNNEIVDFIKQAKKEKKTIVDVVKEYKR
ncbi:hypothetical protein [Enterococcus sp. AZ126]|uniref:hypothetical protein n=1 Tax=Enterococcus sp. AZ126 TaxID=2774635 RepID=UPI003F27AA89